MIKLENTEVLGWEAAIRGMRNPMNSWEKSDTIYVPDTPRLDYHGNVVETVPAHYQDTHKPVEQGDSVFGGQFSYGLHENVPVSIGPNDHKLMMSLAKGGSVHAKYRRMIMVYVDITAPLYWWKEFDTYKVGTVANSCSTMHKIHSKEFTLDDFSHEDLLTFQDSDFSVDEHMIAGEDYWDPKFVLEMTVRMLNHWRDIYNKLDARIKAKSKSGNLTAAELKHLMSLRKRAWKQMIQLLPTSYNQKRTVMMPYEVLANIHPSRRHHKLDEWHVFCDWIEQLPYSELITGVPEDL